MNKPSSTMISLYPYVLEKAVSACSGYADRPSDRIQLLRFMDANNWFHLTPEYRGDDVLIPETDELDSRLGLWLSAYGKSAEEKLCLLLHAFGSHLPRTCSTCRNWLDHNTLWKRGSALQAVDHLLYCASRLPGTSGGMSGLEVQDFSDEEIREMFASGAMILGKAAFDLLQDLVRHARGAKDIWTYRRITPDYVKRDTSAYPIDVYSTLSYWIFNLTAWEKNDLIGKARADRTFAALWLFAAIHFIAALRRSDILRLPAPVVDTPARELVGRILPDDEPWKAAAEQEAVMLAAIWQEQIRALGLKPNKTSRYANVPTLKVFIPESLKSSFGTFLALALDGYEPGTPFLSCSILNSRYRSFFGKDFSDVLHGRSLSTRRANKSYLQAIEMLADTTDNSAMGYLLACMARSHKGSPGKLAESTAVYLRDACFAGQTPVFILSQMFERGIFGFLPVMLLERFDKAGFRSIAVAGQTQLITDFGLKPWQLEGICQLTMDFLEKAKSAVSAFLARAAKPGDDFQEVLRETLMRFTLNPSSAKTENLYCLQLSVGGTCPFPDRSCCIGCGSEIYTRSFLYQLVREYIILNAREKDASGPEKERLKLLRQRGLYPIIAQFIQTFPLLYPDSSFVPMRAMARQILTTVFSRTPGSKEANHE